MNPPPFDNITLIGGGLIGGSIALAIQRLVPAPAVRLWTRRVETADRARELGIISVSEDLSDAVRDADLCILCVPVGAMPGVLAAAMDAGLPETCLVTDVGSVKAVPHRTLAPMLAHREVPFIGSHPMAGSERNGIEAITPELFRNSACILTNDERAPAEAAARVESFWRSLGCRTSWMHAAVHDELVARISHLPHVIAASAARVCLRHPHEGRYCGGGLRDTTRVAAGNASMWAEIITENRQALIEPLRESISDLTEILAIMESGDREAARIWLDRAKQLRDALRLIT